MSTRTWLATALGAAVIVMAGCASDPPSAVVGLKVDGCPPGTANGTGTIVAPGLVLTSAHVVKGGGEVRVIGRSRTATGTVVAFDPEMDLAYVQVDQLVGAPLGVSSTSDRGADATAYVYRDGAVQVIPARVRRPVRIHTEDIYIEGDTYRPGIELDADIRAGDSGGPVVVDGAVVGVIWARSSKYENRAYAIDPVAAGELVREQLRSGLIGDGIDLERCN